MVAWSLKSIIIGSWFDKLIRETEYFIAYDCKMQWFIPLDWWEKIELCEVNRDMFIEICCNNKIDYLELVMKVMHARIHNTLDDLKSLFFKNK